MPRPLPPAALTLLALALLAPAAVGQASIRDLGSFRPTGVSDDGRVVSGDRSGSGDQVTEAIRWTEGEGIGVLPSFSNVWDRASAVSADGTVLVGYSYGYDGPGNFAVRWGEDGDAEFLGVLEVNDDLQLGSHAEAVSADGSVVVGFSEVERPGSMGSGQVETEQAFRWEGGVMTGLGYLDGSSVGSGPQSTATGVSADGAVVVGFSLTTALAGCAVNPCRQAFRWEGGQMQGLGVLGSGSESFSYAQAVSADGRVVVGKSSSSSALYGEAVRWEGGQMRGLGVLPGDVESIALAVSADGSLIVGESVSLEGDETIFLWTAAGGMRALRPYLLAQGVDLSGWTLGRFGGLSANGNYLVGFAGNGAARRAWRVALVPPQDIVVNDTRDLPNLGTADGRCDAVDDAEESGDQCTLRAAIELANEKAGANTIRFDLDGTAPFLIAPESALPAITDALTLDGLTQPGANDEVAVEIGGDATADADGLDVRADDVTLRGLSVTGFDGWGVRVDGADGVTVERMAIGYPLRSGPAFRPNGAGAVLAENGAHDVTIGGTEADDQNRLYGTVAVRGDLTDGVSVLRNEIALDPVAVGVTQVPIDLAAGGPSCTPWAGGDGPNGGMPAPRLLSITSGTVTGLTRPGARVVVFRTERSLLGTGHDRGRYWPASVLPVGTAEADGTGAFAVALDETLAVGDYVTASATDAGGSTSELAQLKRPVIFLPGIGGSWLEATAGAGSDANLWIPLGGFPTDAALNDRLARMAMDPFGQSLEPVVADGIVEDGAFGYGLPYYDALAAITAAGYPGDVGNDDRATNDLWRFDYDWRLHTIGVAARLRELVDELTGGADDVAVSCEVDLVAHSMGGVVANDYVRGEPEHARDHVHRYLTVATPYLGASQAAAAHSVGYVFDVEEALSFEVEWGRMITMARNIPAIYGLMPSRAFWDAAAPASPSHRHGYLFQDLDGRPVRSWGATRDFLAAPKRDAAGRAFGLGRNGRLIDQQQTEVHDLIDDWRGWDGPPQVFRQVGLLAGSTTTGWRVSTIVPELVLPERLTPRAEVGDTDRHRTWRTYLQPVLGTGDATVPLVSATLGHHASVGRVDFSGEDSDWIEPFEYYPCTHTGILADACTDTRGESALGRIQAILRSGYLVIPEPATRAAGGDPPPGAEALYVVASGPVTVEVTDATGARTGPRSREAYRVVEHGLGGIGYWPGERSATVSVPTTGAYTLTVEAPVEGVQARVYRLQIDADDAQRRSVLYADQSLDVGGRLRLSTLAGGTPAATPLSLDADGDGAFERSVAPSAVLTGTGGVPAVPTPEPAVVRAGTLEGSVTVELALPDVGTDGWTWTLSETADWITTSATSGTVPATITLRLAADLVSDTLATATLQLTLRHGDYAVEAPVPVELRTDAGGVDAEDGPDRPTALRVSAVAPNPARARAAVVVGLPAEAHVTVELFDVLGRRVGVLDAGPLAGGEHALALDTSPLPAGPYIVRVAAGGEVTTRPLTVVR
ncbi:lipase/acyltransferase domain-containing protein [Rubrivirga marina]|uniref:Secretion system C-terminal sorting domain-containing protein n=1 Tax=Rubrivirga marina TaxID=1196024 RepID=A0A271IZ33_9BACT|nr:T9SS type A sorting domain-containing protein [Rubrivirga marina]PAP76483.1 hypothetical protein BSZ37_08535 [Rubrivirga marina]